MGTEEILDRAGAADPWRWVVAGRKSCSRVVRCGERHRVLGNLTNRYERSNMPRL
jgi:hypothetical protein